MVFEQEFYFNGIPRWNLGWATPNYAGAFLATVICFLWAIQGKKYQRYIGVLGLLIESALYFSIAKTYSRGALLALGVGAVFFLGASIFRAHSQQWRIWLLRAVILVACLIGTGLLGRVDPSYLASDGAVTNRLGLWRSGMEMVACAPWSGWGAGESGRAYMNWFQDLTRSEQYSTMVNSYLHVAVEYGLPVLAGVLVGLVSILVMGWCTAARGDVIAGSAGASLSAWAVANIFTTLWIKSALWGVPVIATVLILWRGRGLPGLGKSWLKAVAFGAAFSVAAAAMLYVGGAASAKRYTWRIQPLGDGVVRMVNCPDAADAVRRPVWQVWSDAAVFGERPGKELRRWAAKVQHVDIYHYSASWRATDGMASGDAGMMLSGHHSDRLAEPALPMGRSLWVVHPTLPPVQVAEPWNSDWEVVVVLPEIDETGLNETWRGWAKRVNGRVVLSPGCGIDIRSVWPAVAPEANDASCGNYHWAAQEGGPQRVRYRPLSWY